MYAMAGNSQNPAGESAMPRVLVADDQPSVQEAMRLLLKGNGMQAELAGSPGEVLAAVLDRRLDAILIDLNYTRGVCTGEDGLELLSRLQSLERDLPVIVMTAWGSVDLAVEAMRRGARDFIQKPWENEKVLRILRANIGRTHRVGDADARDMTIARRVQKNLFPHEGPPLETLEYSGACLQAGAVGGDYFDLIARGDRRVAMLVADVSGKGVSAALLMAHLQATLRSRSSDESSDPRSLLTEVNRLFHEATAPEHFATMFYAEYNDSARRLDYVNCGQQPPVLLRADGIVERLAATATVLGVIEPWECEAAKVDLAPGDTLAIFSDGVVEAESPAGDQFGDVRLIRRLRGCQAAAPSAAVRHLIEAIEEFSGPSHDDLTLLIARAR
jgi:sigma-B regulation protein RsbU (phosphoserine phosphatase)